MTTALSFIRLIHRAQDSFIPFCRKEPDGKFISLCSLTPSEVATNAGILASHMGQNAYFSVNGMFRAGWGLGKIVGLPAALRGKTHLRYLNACYVDLDFGRDDGITYAEAMSHVTDLMVEGVLPQISLSASSGQGAYLFWVLHDEKNRASPARAWKERLKFYKQINEALGARLQDLHPDKGCCDAARVLRVPGTRHSKSGVCASYSAYCNPDGQVFSHTLDDLAQALGLSLPLSWPVASSLTQQDHKDDREATWSEADEAGREFSVSAPSGPTPREPSLQPEEYGRKTQKPGSAPARVKGPQTLNYERSEDLLALEKDCGGWRKGTRRHRLAIYAQLLRGAGEDRLRVICSVHEMAKRCQPPYPSDANDEAVAGIVRFVFDGRIKKYKRQTLVEMLDVSSEQARRLRLRKLIPDDVHQERQESERPPSAQQKVQQRREFIQEHLREHGLVSVQKMSEVLLEAGYIVGRSIVAKDMNLVLPQGTQRIPAGRPRSAQLRLDF